MSNQEQQRPTIELEVNKGVAAKEYLSSLDGLSKDLPAGKYWESLQDRGRVSCPAIDSFIEKYAFGSEYADKARQLELVAVIIDAEYVRKLTSGAIDSGVLSEGSVEVCKKRLRDAEESLKSGLETAYSAGGRKANEGFGVLYRRFFSDARKDDINRVVEIRTRFFDPQGYLTNQNLDVASMYFGLLRP